MSRELLYRLVAVEKEFEGPSETLRILRKIDLDIPQGESLAVVGASGSGKTTLLHLLGTLDTASSGQVFLDGVDLTTLDNRQKARLRNRDIGFVFQFHHLLPEFSTLENVAMPAFIGKMGRSEGIRLAKEALEMVGLGHRLDHKVTTLSGGERQRAAIARAILLKPKVLLADEPTGNLDEENGAMIGNLLVSLNKELGMTFVVVTHNPELAGMMHRRVELRLGELYAL
ncbi:outer membrane-specific lipoprotein transporter subunit; ATP-binding component of ABC superfamily [Pseudodesulfovibrio profundus]|uniref:Outer membrane-specific lipoprotein transporter subunit ATP-binding component of ABC superfamily n=1 Tax=Pseudodesulfovibrio profundus TaxID=57320 RepID=A0A2C8F3Y3_9BACT|nr:ABC transporter ATP-binding protein [Pseudodesulfovibrio profundus]SOB57116.1 outer membrane-specific lipoprotein transporter subunit; ATP-binding component of ABC superfamily [Pseudodesulfovibrio profundus]HBU36784.1 ABC transporter ATP-binding protein [Planctomycetaceae bacterium]|tara:strand:- start:221 stop:904 length:684 start_codon:yes stop_codon:yes gene_type:complete